MVGPDCPTSDTVNIFYAESFSFTVEMINFMILIFSGDAAVKAKQGGFENFPIKTIHIGQL